MNTYTGIIIGDLSSGNTVRCQVTIKRQTKEAAKLELANIVLNKFLNKVFNLRYAIIEKH